MLSTRSRAFAALSTLAALTFAAGTAGTLALRSASLATTSAAHAAAEATPFTIDPVHSTVLFRVKHLNASHSYGRFNEPTGTFLLDPADAAGSSINITLDINKIDTANDKRDAHLRSPDFFSAKEFASATFKSTSVTPGANDSFTVEGDLTIRGVTKKVSTTLTKVGEGPGMQGKTVYGFDASFTIKRSDFAIDYGPKVLGDEVTLTIAIEGAR